ncbi:hypothetical protein BKN38_02365 [Helicobacter sp. CLO-3]|uniref:hypothetical protein n=1 Tax=unclassified Helicobacter TaxID=2593540 RepID=UPI000805DB84|nr:MULTISPECIES: hypothetical protein [unclassified Helicobacter]OBV29449.1 hypothetical protein BA723_00665 [Helicobacter sp. CLO-3]OHU84654.1 hypothetical protein BKN38_02365 [Helicobacter sp. CLO-3]
MAMAVTTLVLSLVGAVASATAGILSVAQSVYVEQTMGYLNAQMTQTNIGIEGISSANSIANESVTNALIFAPYSIMPEGVTFEKGKAIVNDYIHLQLFWSKKLVKVKSPSWISQIVRQYFGVKISGKMQKMNPDSSKSIPKCHQTPFLLPKVAGVFKSAGYFCQVRAH